MADKLPPIEMPQAKTLTVAPSKASARLKSLEDTHFYAKGLVYGMPGSGKTYAVCRAPQPLLLIISDWAVARPTILRVRKEYGIDPDVIEVNSWSDYMEAYKYASAHASEYACISVDGISDMNERIGNEILTDAIAYASKSDRKTHDPDALEMGDWNKVGNRTIYSVRLFRDLPCHVLFTALENEINMLLCPMVQPKSLLRKFPSYFNLVGHLVCEEQPKKASKRILQLDSSYNYMAKNPGGALPSSIEDPDFSVIIPQIVDFLATGGG